MQSERKIEILIIFKNIKSDLSFLYLYILLNENNAFLFSNYEM